MLPLRLVDFRDTMGEVIICMRPERDATLWAFFLCKAVSLKQVYLRLHRP